MSKHFPELKSLGGKVKVELNMSNYATKTDLKTPTEIDTSSFAKRIDLASLKSSIGKVDIDKLKNVTTNLSNSKSKIDKLDIRKLETTQVDLSKLRNVVEMMLLKKMYIMLR